MPSSGRELHDLRAAVKAFVDRYPARTRRALDDDVRTALKLGDEILKVTEPAGRGGDGEESPGERTWRRAAEGLASASHVDDGTYNRATLKMRGKSGSYSFKHIGSERGQKRGTAQEITDLRDLGR